MGHREHDFAADVRAQGFRLTPQRELVLDTLCELGGHVPLTTLVTAVGEKSAAVDRATVYRTVSFFAELGIVASTEINGVTVVEIAPEQTAAHGHLVCQGCGAIVHLPADFVAGLSRQVETQFGFMATARSFAITGYCEQCK